MTQEIQWGPAIAVDGKRPAWLCDGEWRRVRSLAAGTWQTADVESPGDTIPDMDEWIWDDISHIRLPADHPHYRQPAPIDWSGELEAVHEDGRVVAVKLHSDDGGKLLPMRIDRKLSDGVDDCIEYFDRDGSCNVGKWRIRNVTPQPAPQADTKPDVTARMEALVREVDEHGPHAFITKYMAEEARAIVALLPEPVDPVEAIVDELMRKDCTTRQAIEEAVQRGRELALAEETGK